MKKRQAEQYFLQLKKIDHDRNITLAELINILTGGSILVRDFYHFIDYLKSNEFGEYSHLDQNIHLKDWRQLEFSTIYELLKAIKDFIIKKSHDKKETSVTHSHNRDLGSSMNSQKDSQTVIDLLSGLAAVQEPKANKQREEKRFEQKWKKYKLRVLKKLLIIFDSYRKAMWVKDQTFEKKQSLSQKFDLTMFMRYFKDFQLSPAFQLQRVIRVFKANAINTIWLDFDRFVNTHLHLIGFKEGVSNEDKYLKLRGFNQLLSAQKMKKMLNVRREHIVTSVVEPHTGAYREDIIKHLQQKAQERKERINKKWSGKSIKTQRSLQNDRNSGQSISKVRQLSVKNLQRTKTEAPPSVYEQLKLPKLRLKQHRQESIYRSLNMLDLSQEQQKIREMVGMQESEEFLQQYLKEQDKMKEKVKGKKRQVELPRMKFT